MSCSPAGAALAVYGTLAPGQPNHWMLAKLEGQWTSGTVEGHVFEITWGEAEGYLGFVSSRDGNRVAVQVLLSADLEKNWHLIDQFEGPGYERLTVEVRMSDDSTQAAQIYAALTTN